MLQTQRAQKAKKKVSSYGKKSVAVVATKDPWDDDGVKASVYDVSSPSSESASSARSGSSWDGGSDFSCRTSTSGSRKPAAYAAQKTTTYNMKKKGTSATAVMGFETSQPQKGKDDWMFGSTAEKENKASAQAKPIKTKPAQAKPIKTKPAQAKPIKTKRPQKAQKPQMDYSDFFEEKETKQPSSTPAYGTSSSSDSTTRAGHTDSSAVPTRAGHTDSSAVPKLAHVDVPETPEAYLTKNTRARKGPLLAGGGDGGSEDCNKVIPESPSFSLCSMQFQATSTPFCDLTRPKAFAISPLPVLGLSSPDVDPVSVSPGRQTDTSTAAPSQCSSDADAAPSQCSSDADADCYTTACSSVHEPSCLDARVETEPRCLDTRVETESDGQSTPKMATTDEDEAERGGSTPQRIHSRTRNLTAASEQKSHRRKSLALRKSRYVVGTHASPPLMVADSSSIGNLQDQLAAIDLTGEAQEIAVKDQESCGIEAPAVNEKSCGIEAPAVNEESCGIEAPAVNARSPDMHGERQCGGQSAGHVEAGEYRDLCKRPPASLDPAVLARHQTANLIGDVTIADWVFPSPVVPVSPRQQLLSVCGQTEPVPLSDVFSKSMLRHCCKVGEGVYGEVFLATNSQSQPVALKVIPIEGSHVVNGEPQKSFAEMIPEMVISSALSRLGDTRDSAASSIQNFTSNFITLNRVACCRGSYPKSLLKLWDNWDRDHTSENDRPDFYPTTQLFVVFEFANGGRDLEHSTLCNMQQALSVFQQVAMALATAEQAVDFEHRDLHWGNILLRSCPDTDVVSCCVDGIPYSVPSCGFQVSLIDFTLSRLTHEGATVFCDLSVDPTLFTGKGDFQFDVYRLMRAELGNDWSQAKPLTNVIWLQYVVDKLLHSVKYTQRSAQRSTRTRLNRLFQRLKSRTYASALQVLQQDEVFAQATSIPS